jgi:hypothetical protein
MKTIQEIEKELWDKFPKSKEIILKDQSARTFFELLLREDSYKVIDEMFFYYVSVNNGLENSLLEYIKRYGSLDDDKEILSMKKRQ